MIGSDYPIRVQSMTNTNTNDIEASVAQCKSLAAAGAEIVRLTAQGVREAQSIGEIRTKLRESGCNVPLVADIHFNPKAAFAAAAVTDKVRINPGNFIDPARQFKTLSYSDEEYDHELQRIHDALVPFIDICREHHTAVRLGVSVALTTLIAAESTGATAGLGMRIRALSSSFETEPMMLYIIVVGIIGMVAEKTLKFFERRLTSWQEKREI